MNRRKKRYQFKKKFVKTIERRIVRKLMQLAKKDISDIICNLPKLSLNDKLFVESDNLNNSCLNRNKNIRDIHLAESYFCTAILLLDLIKMSKCNSIKDGYIYPALFAFRHSLELIMKDTLNILVGKNNVADVVKNKVHNLETIWNVFKNKAPYDETTIVIDNLIKELSNTDPNSFNFRYSYDIKGNPIDISLNNEFVMDDDIRKKKTFIIDNENLKMIMLKMYDYFDRINWQMQK